MPEVNISDGAKTAAGATGKSASAVKNASDTIGNITTLLAKSTDLLSHVENIVSMFRGREGGESSSIIQSKGTAPPVTQVQAPAPAAVAAPVSQAVTDQSMEAYFSSSEGLKKISSAIDKMIPLIGDLKLSEVKQAIEKNISPKKTEKKGVKKK